MKDLQAELDRVRQELIATEEAYTKARAHGHRQEILELEGTLNRLNYGLTDLLERMGQTKA